jgi:hypothetical protein
MSTITINDETASGKIIHILELLFPNGIITVKQLIVQRVRQEVKEYNMQKPEYFNGLVQPTESEQTLNGYRLRSSKSIDAEKQVIRALEAFSGNGYFIIINDKQVESLDEEFLLSENTNVSFIKLTPLIGG